MANHLCFSWVRFRLNPIGKPMLTAEALSGRRRLLLVARIGRHNLHLLSATDLGVRHTVGAGTGLLVNKLRPALLTDTAISRFACHINLLLGVAPCCQNPTQILQKRSDNHIPRFGRNNSMIFPRRQARARAAIAADPSADGATNWDHAFLPPAPRQFTRAAPGLAQHHAPNPPKDRPAQEAAPPPLDRE